MTQPRAQQFDVIVLGAGAAGLMCAATAGQRGKRVRVVERADRPGKKIRISGGGRCNFTNLDVRPECFLSENPHFAKSALRRYQPTDFIALVDAHGIAWHEKTLGQLFCDGSAAQIVDLLLDECAKGEVQIGLGETIREVAKPDDRFQIVLESETLTAPTLVIATGGPSIPKMGATGFAYDLARQFGLAVVTPRPALVPLTLGENDNVFTSLPGVSAPCIATCGGASFAEAFLFTHRGLSGPAILQVSSYWSPGETVALDMTPGRKPGWLPAGKRANPRARLRTAISEGLPLRLASALVKVLSRDTAIDIDKDIGNVSDRHLEVIERRLSNWTFSPTGTEGFAKAEVTAGGISTMELSSRTMEAKTVSGLYAIGEAVDVTGWLGGYNFQWAWASGHAAGQAV